MKRKKGARQRVFFLLLQHVSVPRGHIKMSSALQGRGRLLALHPSRTPHVPSQHPSAMMLSGLSTALRQKTATPCSPPGAFLAIPKSWIQGPAHPHPVRSPCLDSQSLAFAGAHPQSLRCKKLREPFLPIFNLILLEETN